MRTEVIRGPLTATLRECWARIDNLRQSAEIPGWSVSSLIHAIVIESVAVEDQHRRMGHLKRFVESLCLDERFEMVIVEAVQNPILADALLRWGWDCDPQIMDFYRRRISVS